MMMMPNGESSTHFWQRKVSSSASFKRRQWRGFMAISWCTPVVRGWRVEVLPYQCTAWGCWVRKSTCQLRGEGSWPRWQVMQSTRLKISQKSVNTMMHQCADRATNDRLPGLPLRLFYTRSRNMSFCQGEMRPTPQKPYEKSRVVITQSLWRIWARWIPDVLSHRCPVKQFFRST